MTRYAKALIAVLGAVAAALELAYPSWLWLPAVTAGVTAAGVYLVPNSAALGAVPPRGDRPQQVSGEAGQPGAGEPGHADAG